MPGGNYERPMPRLGQRQLRNRRRAIGCPAEQALRGGNVPRFDRAVQPPHQRDGRSVPHSAASRVTICSRRLLSSNSAGDAASTTPTAPARTTAASARRSCRRTRWRRAGARSTPDTRPRSTESLRGSDAPRPCTPRRPRGNRRALRRKRKQQPRGFGGEEVQRIADERAELSTACRVGREMRPHVAVREPPVRPGIAGAGGHGGDQGFRESAVHASRHRVLRRTSASA